jgi:catechol 2,3-dioxygenase-like lactoylglutathione lyase family enzyme
MAQPISRRYFLASAAVLFAPAMAWSADSVPPLLDHVILGCNDLDRGIAFMKKNLGVTAVASGVHPGRGTRNALLALGDHRYLEILAPDPAQNVSSPQLAKLARMPEPKLLTWAVHPHSIEELASYLKSESIPFDGPTDGSRKRPDGKLLRWRVLTL